LFLGNKKPSEEYEMSAGETTPLEILLAMAMLCSSEFPVSLSIPTLLEYG